MEKMCAGSCLISRQHVLDGQVAESKCLGQDLQDVASELEGRLARSDDRLQEVVEDLDRRLRRDLLHRQLGRDGVRKRRVDGVDGRRDAKDENKRKFNR